MLHHLIFLTSLISITKSHTPRNSSDVIIVGGHSDMHDSFFVTTGKSGEAKPKTTPPSDSDEEYMKNGESKKNDDDDKKGDVLFIPTEGYVFKNDETVHEDTVRMADVLENKRQGGARETESPPGDILFIEGKNSDRQERPYQEERRRKGSNNDQDREFKYIDYDDEETTTATTPIPMDCTNLDCDNTIDSICGGKLERSNMKYRLFKNECFFRKVNCAFTYEMNRYLQVDEKNCEHVGMHVTGRTNDFPIYFPIETQRVRPSRRQNENQPRRRSDGRRAMAMNLGGSYCAHPCPIVCTEEYAPECALSAEGERRVFTNHCQLDRNSCQFQMLWRRRPLAECTGGMKADMHQNRAFIDWMQRVGIVDRKGKLVLNR